MVNSYEIYAIKRLIHRFDYDGVMEILDLLDWKEQQPFLYNFVWSCQRSLNFNFQAAKALTDQVNAEQYKPYPGMTRLVDELSLLIIGKPHEVFNELMDNIVIQLEREAYADFLGRIFQLRELLYKYAVIEFKLRKEYSLRDRIYQKNVFEHQFKLYRGLMNGMKEILRSGGGRWQKIVGVLSGRQMSELMDLRHRTIVAHGIETVTLQEIERIFESPDHILKELFQVFQWLNIPVREHKYKQVNTELLQILDQIQDMST